MVYAVIEDYLVKALVIEDVDDGKAPEVTEGNGTLKYIEYVLLFSILILGQNVVSYNVQNELRLVKKGFPLRYSLKEKLQCKSVIGMFLLLLPMLCYWIAYKFELFSILLWIWMPIQSIIIYTAKNRLQRLLYILPFYILSLLSMRVW